VLGGNGPGGSGGAVADTAVTSVPHGLAVAIGLLLTILGHEVVRRRREPRKASELASIAGTTDAAAALIAERLLVYCPDPSVSTKAPRHLETQTNERAAKPLRSRS